MGSAQLGLCLLLFVHAILLLPSHCNDIEDKLLNGINRFRGSSRVSALSENDNAECLADEIADKIEHQPCTVTNGVHAEPGSKTRFSDYPEALKKCHININTTKDGLILTACVPDLDSDLVLSNFTHSRYAEFVNNSKFTGAGIGSEDDWIVVVLSTNTTAGRVESKASFVSMVGMNHCLLSLLVGLFLALMN